MSEYVTGSLKAHTLESLQKLQVIDGIFPQADTEVEDFEAEENIPIHSAENLDSDSMEQMEGYAKKGWLEETSSPRTRAKIRVFFIVSRFCVLSQEKQWILKKRLIEEIGHLTPQGTV